MKLSIYNHQVNIGISWLVVANVVTVLLGQCKCAMPIAGVISYEILYEGNMDFPLPVFRTLYCLLPSSLQAYSMIFTFPLYSLFFSHPSSGYRSRQFWVLCTAVAG